jgi:hypothetical protein
MALEYVGNSDRMTVTLGSGYTAASGTMSLTGGHGARLPSSGDFWIVTTSGTYRAFKVTARSTDTLTVTAAQDGTSDGNLDAGTELEWSMTASALDEYGAGMVASGAYGSLPSAGKEGRLYIPTGECPYLFRDNGASWDATLPGHGDVTLPSTSGWSDWQSTSPVYNTTTGYLEITSGLIQRALPSAAPWEAIFGIRFVLDQEQDFSGVYVGFGQNSTNEDDRMNFSVDNSSPRDMDIARQKFLSNVWQANYIWYQTAEQFLPYGYGAGVIWIKIEDDNSNRIISYSTLGPSNWMLLHSIGRTDYLTADRIMAGVASGSVLRILHYEET